MSSGYIIVEGSVAKCTLQFWHLSLYVQTARVKICLGAVTIRIFFDPNMTCVTGSSEKMLQAAFSL